MNQSVDLIVHDGIRVATEIVKQAIILIDDPEKTGGYLSIASSDGCPLFIRVPILAVPEEKTSKYFELSFEKMDRLHDHPDHSTSYESRDPKAEIVTSDGKRMPWGRWGGAIRAGMFLLSFSGLPELWDEAAMFACAIRMKLIEKREILDKIGAERNPHLRPLLDKCGL